jgi:hypothetical protein
VSNADGTVFLLTEVGSLQGVARRSSASEDLLQALLKLTVSRGTGYVDVGSPVQAKSRKSGRSRRSRGG